ncbi:MAG TPA: LPS export ABC transporter periplasmic protein LptC [Gemmatimonas sp.]|nr:LPS export ABC transporter periplasmic protein LptC [Gemmatimonas sp.]
MATLSVAACGEKPTATAATTKQQSSAQHEQVMFGTVGVLTSNGTARGTIKADSALVHGGGERLELRNVTATLVDSAGADSSTITARTGTYLVARSKLTLRGAVRVLAPGGRRLQAESLSYDLAVNAINSAGAYTLTGSSVQRINGVLVIDPMLRRSVKPKSDTPAVKPAANKRASSQAISQSSAQAGSKVTSKMIPPADTQAIRK